MKIMAIKIFDVSSLFFILVLLSVTTECSSVDCCCGTTLFLPAGMIERIFSEKSFSIFCPQRCNRWRNVLSVSSIGNFCMSFCMRRMRQGKNNSANSEYSYSLYDYLGDFKCVEWRWRQKDGEGSNIYDSAGGLYSSKLYIGVILIFGILSYLYWNEVNGKDNNENYEKKRFKHMLKSNPWERYLIILCVWGAKTYWKKYLVNQLLLHWLSGVSFPSYFIVVFNIIFNCSVWKMLKRIILWIIILGENYMKIL